MEAIPAFIPAAYARLNLREKFLLHTLGLLFMIGAMNLKTVGTGLFLACTLALQAAPAPADTAEAIPAFGLNTRVLFQGDSITDGNRGRSPDPNHILGHGYVFIIGAKFGADFAPSNLVFINRGISGNTVLDLERRWQVDTLDLQPDLLSVLIGVNDLGRNVSPAMFERTYDQLLTGARTANPKLKLVLCEPFTLPTGGKKDNYEPWREAMRQRQQAVERLARKHQAALVRFQKVFDDACQRAPAERWIWDGVHPTYAGHQLMADEWVRSVREFFK